VLIIRVHGSSAIMCHAGQLMMVQKGLIGLGAGAAAALLFASPASGAPLALLLLILAPLPIVIAAVGWSHWAGLFAVAVAAIALTLVFGINAVQPIVVPFVLGVGAPAWWLGYLALLGRPDPASGGIEWYPAGSLVFWSALIGALDMLAVIPFYGWDQETFQATLRGMLEAALRVQGDAGSAGAAPLPGVSDTARFIDFLVDVMPPAAAALGTVTNLLNLWLAGRVLDISGRLRRPWPDLPAMRLPPIAPMLLIVALIGSFAGGMLGIAAGIVGAALLIAHSAIGLAVVHMVTRGMPGRGGVLAVLYAAVPIFALLRVLHWPVLAFTALALIDFIFDLRGRTASRRPPAVRE
jgi:Predicted membrane protein (DUF2232)